MNRKNILDKILDKALFIIVVGFLMYFILKVDKLNSELLKLTSDYIDLTIKYSDCVNSNKTSDLDKKETIDFKTETEK